MTVKDIVRKWLEENGYEGLVGTHCGCELADLMPCWTEGCPDCEPGFVVRKEDYTEEEREYWQDYDFFVTTIAR
jgi:hypothetical protein